MTADREPQTDPVDEMVRVITQTLGANALILTTSRGGYPHPTLDSDAGAVEAVARGLLARRVAEPSRTLPPPAGIDVRRMSQAITNIAARHGLMKDPPPPLMHIYGYSKAMPDMDAEIVDEYARLAPQPTADAGEREP